MAATSATTAAAAGASGAAPAGWPAGPTRRVTGERLVGLVLVGRLFVGYVLVRLDHVNLDLDLKVHVQVFELGGVNILGQIHVTGIYVSV